jgi:aryl-phospho-beta-D-glucosidase BglC (GH1 family)
MSTKFIAIPFFLLGLAFPLSAQLTPWEATNMMGHGINIGNSLEAPTETSWGNPAIVEGNFDDYKAAGFTSIRIPITWGTHTGLSSPYAISASFLNRVEQVVDWALARGFIVIINAHHDSWIKENFTDANIARFDSIWSQIATRFKDKSDHLLFEIINEPYPLSQSNVDTLNAKVLSIIRRTNPTRIVVFSGYMWSNADELIAAKIPNDTMLIGYYHSYDPYPFGLEGPGTFGSDADISTMNARFDKVKKWSTDHNIPVILSEYGATKKCEYNSRMCYYATVNELAILHNIPAFAWDDGGDFQIYLRSQRKWNEIKDIIINTYPQSPNKMVIGNYADTLAQVQWNNRNPYNDSIIIERKINSGDFVFYKKVAPNTTLFIDSNVTTINNNYYYYRLKTRINDTTWVQSYPVSIQNIKPSRTAYNNTIAKIPGTIEAENFDSGLEGDAYHDADVVNTGNYYRLGSGVDIYKGKGNSVFVGNTHAGEWMEYTVNITKQGKYAINAYVSCPAGGGSFKIQFGNNQSFDFQVDRTDTIVNFIKVSQEAILDSGQQVMRIQFNNDIAIGIDRINFSFITGISSVEEGNFIFGPNPFTSYVQFETKSIPTRIEIYNVCGILIKSITLNSTKQVVSTSDMPKGIYILKASNSKQSWTTKLIKQ